MQWKVVVDGTSVYEGVEREGIDEGLNTGVYEGVYTGVYTGVSAVQRGHLYLRYSNERSFRLFFTSLSVSISLIILIRTLLRKGCFVLSLHQ